MGVLAQFGVGDRQVMRSTTGETSVWSSVLIVKPPGVTCTSSPSLR
jgi:hypothetical protein